MAADIGATPFLRRVCQAVTGIKAKSYQAEVTADINLGTDEAGENVAANSRNLKATHSWEGEILAGTSAGVVLEIPGSAIATPPSGLWAGNGMTTGILFAVTCRYMETAGEYAKFALDAEKHKLVVTP